MYFIFLFCQLFGELFIIWAIQVYDLSKTYEKEKTIREMRIWMSVDRSESCKNK